MAQTIFGDKDVAIFLDSDNCKFTSRIDQLITHIESSLQTIDPEYIICTQSRVYSGATNVYLKPQHARMRSLNFKFLPALKKERWCSCGYSTAAEGEADEFDRPMDVADALLIDEMLGRVLNGQLRPNILLISTDRDFNEALGYLFNSEKFNIFVAKNKPTDPDRPFCPSPFARVTWDWLKLQVGEASSHQRPEFDYKLRRNNRNRRKN